jgi:recombination protein RecT
MSLNQPTQLASIKNHLTSETAIAMFQDYLPNATGEQAREMAKRFGKMVYAVVSMSPDLQNCSVPSIVRAAAISASLDLDIDPRGLAYLVPYKGEANFQVGYQGLMELAYRSGKVKNISAHCIYASEKGKVIIKRIDGQFTVEHPFEWETPTGEVVAVYATAHVEGFGAQTCVLRKDEIEAIRKHSKCPNSPAWKESYAAMAKKTAIRQLAKYLPKSVCEDLSRGAAMDEAETFTAATVTAETHIAADMGTQVVDADFIPDQGHDGDTPDFMRE